MPLAQDLEQVSASVEPEQFQTFQRHMDPGFIRQALEATGTATIRKRRLPAEQVVWLVIGMAMFVLRSMKEVVASLDLALPAAKEVAASAITQARTRVGAEPLKWLFGLTGRVWGGRSMDTHRWRDLQVLGMDMTTLRVPDSQENRDTFGGQSASAKRGPSGYPMIRLVALMALRSHIVLGGRMGPYKGSSESSLAKELLDEIPDDSLMILDRGYLNSAFLLGIEKKGRNRHWLTRAKSDTRWEFFMRQGPGDNLVRLKVSETARKKDPSLPPMLLCRAITYQRKGYQPQTLLTSLMPPSQYPAQDVARMYHERWEIELGFAEVKTRMHDRQETLRSRTPVGVEQELWGLLIAYNLIRVEMEQVAAEANVPPVRISFVMALQLIQTEWMWCGVASPGTIPEKLRRLRTNVARFVLPERRSERNYPRAVKVKMSNYPRKRPTTTGSGSHPGPSGGLK